MSSARLPRVEPALRLFLLFLLLFGTAAAAHAQTCSVTVNAPPQLCATSPATVSVAPPAGGGSWASVSWSISGGAFITGGGTAVSTITGESVTVRADGSGAVTLTTSATNSSSCTTPATVTQIPVEAPVTPVIVAPAEACAYADAAASIAPPASGSWTAVSWSITGGAFRDANGYSSQYATGETVEFFGDGSGPIYLYAAPQHSTGCAVPEATTMVALRTIGAPVINAPAQVCPYRNATATLQPPAEGSWQIAAWSIQNGYFLDQNGYQTQYLNGSLTTVTFAADGTGPVTLSVSAQDSLGCNAMAGTRQVAIRTIPLPVINAPTEVCPYRNATATLQPPAEGSWQIAAWSIQNGYFLDQNGNQTQYLNGSLTTVTFAADGMGPVTLSVSAQDSLGCNALGGTRQVAIRTIPAPVINAPEEVCPWATATASVQPPPQGTWQIAAWSIQNGYFLDQYGNQTQYLNGAQTTVTFASNGSGPVLLSVSAQDSFGCNAMGGTRQVALRTIEPPVITAPPNTCPDAPATASIAPPEEGSWQIVGWSIQNGYFRDMMGQPVNYLAGPTTVTFYANGAGPVLLSVGAQDSLGCHTNLVSTQVAVRTIPAPTITAPPNTCPDAPATASIAPPAEGSWVNVYWSIQNGYFRDMMGQQVTYVSGPTMVSFYANGSGPVTLSVGAQDSFGCYTPMGTKTVAVRTIPAPAITAPPNTCPDAPTTAAISAPAEGSWVNIYWSIQNGYFRDMMGQQVTYVSGPTMVSFYANGTGPVTLSVSAQDSFGCYTPMGTKTVAVRTIPAPTITAPPNTCPDAPTTAAISAPAEGSWVNVYWSIQNGYFRDMMGQQVTYVSGPTMVSFYANGSGPVTLSVSAQDSFGCYSPMGTKQVTLTSVAAPVITAPSTICGTARGNANIEPPAEGSWQNATWSITGGSFIDIFGNPITPAPGTEYVYFQADGSGAVVLGVTAQHSSGCLAPAGSVTIPQGPPPGPQITTFGGVCLNGISYAEIENTWQNITWSITGGTVEYGGPNGAHLYFTVTDPTVTLTVTATNWEGCTATSTRELEVTPAAEPQISLWRSPACQTIGDSATVTNASEFTYFSWSISGPAYTWGSTYDSTVFFEVYGDNEPVTLTLNAYGACSVTKTITIPVHPTSTPTITANVPIPFCPNTPVTLTASDGVSWWWSTGESTRSITITRGAYVWCSITDANGCQRTAWFEANEYSTPAVSITPSGPTQFCEGGSVTLSATDVAGASYLWSNGATTRTLNVTTSGSYGLTVTYAGGCTATVAPVTVTVNPVPQAATITGDQATICAGNPVLLTANDVAGASYLWSNGATTRSITTDVPGNYTVTVTNASGCSKTSAPFGVTAGTLPSTAPNVEPYFARLCPGATATATVTNAASFARIEWIITNGTIVGPNDQATVTYTVGSTDATLVARGYSATGCYYGTQMNAIVSLPSSDFSAPERMCAGSQTYAYITGANPEPGLVYDWSVTNGTIASYGGGNRSVYFTANGTDPVTLTVTATRGGSCSTTTTHVVEVDSLGQPAITAPVGVCSLTGHTASVTDLGAGVSYAWFITGGTITSGQGTRNITFSVNPSATTVRLSVNASRGACVKSTFRDVLHDEAPATITAYETTFCPGGSATLSASAGASWLWSNGATTRNISVTQAGTYSVTVTSAGGCVSTSAPVTVTAQNPPAPVVIVSPSATCPSQVDLTATLSNAADYTSFYWNSNAAFITSPSNNSTVQLMRAWGTDPTWVEAIATTAAGCTVRTRIDLPVVAGPNPDIITNSAFCEGQTYTATVADAGPGATYLWQLGTATALSGLNQRTITFRANFFNNNPLNLYVEVTDARGCKMLDSVNVPVTPRPNTTITADASICVGPSYPASIPDAGGAAVYQWSITNGTITGGQGTRAITYRANTGGGTVGLSVQVTVNGCVTVGSKSISAQQYYSSFLASGPLTFCEGGSVTLTATDVAGATYLWSNGETTRSIVVTQPGTYSAVMTYPSGCTAPSDHSVTVIVNPAPAAPEITASGPTTFCEGGSVTLTSSAAASYLWSNGATTQSITVSQSGNYSVTATNASGCSATSAATGVVVTANPAATISASGPTTFCTGGSVTLTASSGASYLWSTGQTTQSITVSATGNYSVTVTNAAGCSATSAATAVTVNDNPVATVSASGPTTFCAGGSVTLTASSGSSYLWSNGATTQSITASATGSYSVTVTNASGCSATSAATAVTVNDNPTATISASGPTTFCAGGSVTLTASSGASYLWSNGATTQSITVSATGSYSVTVTNASGCSATSAATAVTVNDNPTATVSASGPTTFCAGGSVTLSAPAGLTYAWSTGETTQSITASATGSYSVTVTNASGCSATSAATAVTVNDNPVATLSASGPTTFCAGGSVTLTASSGASYLWSNGATTQSITASATGSYTVTVTNASGCSATSAATAVTVNDNPVATISASGSTTFCAGGSVTLTASSGASYLWSNGATTQSITASATGNYSVTVTNAAGCSAASAATAVTVNDNPTATISASGPTTFCEGGSVTLTASTGTAYLWSTGATTPSITASATGNYTVTVTNASGCSTTSAATTVTVNANPDATISASGPTTFCEGGSVTLSVPAGGTYAWSTGETTQSITVSETGSYSVTVTNANGCTATSAATAVTVNDAPDFGINVSESYSYQRASLDSAATQSHNTSSTFVYCGSNVSLRLTATALNQTWTYSWSTGQNGPSIVINASGTYTLTVTQPNGCSHSESVTIDIRPAPTVSITGSRKICPGGTTVLTATAGASYLWSTGATTQSIVVDTPGSYSVTVTGENGCPGGASASVTMNDISISADSAANFCAGGSVVLRAASNGGSYLWSNGATTQTITVTEAGSYSVTATFPEGCSLTSNAIAVNVGPSAVSIAVDDDSVCPGTTQQWTSNVTGGSSLAYQWLFEGQPIDGATGPTLAWTPAHTSYGRISLTVTDAATGCSITSYQKTYLVFPTPAPVIETSGPTTFCAGGAVSLLAPGGFSSYLWSTGQTSQSIYVTQPGSYYVTVTNGGGCPGTSAPVVVTVNDPPAKPAVSASGPLTFCQGGSVTLTAPAGFTYNWSTGESTQSITVSTTMSVSVTVTNASGCSATSDPVNVTMNPLPPAVITPSGPTTFCTGGSVTLSAPAGYLYAWSTGATTQSITVSSAGNYTVTVTNANGCSAISAPTAVTVNPNPTATITAGGPTTFCQGGSVTLTASAGTSYSWSTGATTQSITVSSPGNYTVAVTNANGCSATSAPTTVTVNPNPTATITAGGPTTFCTGGSVTLTASAGTSYSWSNGATTQSITVSSTGNYTVAVTNANGCSTTSASTAVTVNPNPTATITAGGPTTFCQGGSVTLTASAGASYLWSTGATTQSITVSATDNYSVIVTNASGCSATSAPTAVTVNPSPATPVVTASGPLTFCQGGSVTLTAPAGFTYLWSNGATSRSITVTQSDNYSVIVTNASGCSATSSGTTVTVNPLPAVPVISGPSSYCPSTSITLSAPAGYSSYLWSNSATTQTISVSTAGQYTVTVSNAQGCTRTSAPFTVTANAPTAITTQPANITMGRNVTAQLSVVATGTATLQYQWYEGLTGDTSKPATGPTATTSTLTIGPYTKKGTLRFWVRVSSSTCTGSTVNSNTATVTVN